MNPGELSRSCYCVSCHAYFYVPAETNLMDLTCPRCETRWFQWGTRPETSWRNVAGATVGALLFGFCGGLPGVILGGLFGFLIASSPGFAAKPDRDPP